MRFKKIRGNLKNTKKFKGKIMQNSNTKKKIILFIILIGTLFSGCMQDKNSINIEDISSEYHVILSGKLPKNGIYSAINLNYYKPPKESEVHYYIPLQYNGKDNFFIYVRADGLQETRNLIKQILMRIPMFSISKKIYFRGFSNIHQALNQDIIGIALEKRKNRFLWLSWDTKKEVIKNESNSYQTGFPFLVVSGGYLMPGSHYHSIHFLGFSNLNESFRFFSNGIYYKNTDVEKTKIHHLQKVKFDTLIKDFVY